MSSLVITCDPGTKAMGWAFWVDGALRAATCSRGARLRTHMTAVASIRNHLRFQKADHIYIEDMVADARGVPPKDLINVTKRSSFVAGRFADRCTWLPPSTWKGTLSKEIHHKRLVKRLSDKEQRVLELVLISTVKTHRKEVLDAVGIGLFALKRVDRGCRAL